MLNKFISLLYKTQDNSRSLFEDAELLSNNDRKERAYTLYHLSFEESGRFFIVLKTLMNYYIGNIELRDLNYGNLKNQGYEKHISKLKESVLKMFTLPILNATENEIEYLTKKYNEFFNDITSSDKKKNLSLYVSHKKNDFYTPSESIESFDVEKAKTLAEIQLATINKFLVYIEKDGGFETIKERIKTA